MHTCARQLRIADYLSPARIVKHCPAGVASAIVSTRGLTVILAGGPRRVVRHQGQGAQPGGETQAVTASRPTSCSNSPPTLARGGASSPLFAFTEQGVAILSRVLPCEPGGRPKIAIMGAFIRLSAPLQQNGEFAITHVATARTHATRCCAGAGCPQPACHPDCKSSNVPFTVPTARDTDCDWPRSHPTEVDGVADLDYLVLNRT